MDLEISKTVARYEKQQERLENDFGWSSTTGPMEITKNYIAILTDSIKDYLVVHDVKEKGFIELISKLDHSTIALCCLSTALNIIGSERQANLTATAVKFGSALEGECFANGLKDHDKQLASRLDKLARTRHGRLKYRRQAVRSIAKKNKFVVEHWNRKQLVIAGNWALNVVVNALPEVFSLVVVNDRGEKQLGLTQDAFDLAEQAIKQAILAYPVYQPSLTPPLAWTDWNVGGNSDPRFQERTTMLRSRHKETAAHVKAAFEAGQITPAVEALNAIQAVGWKINHKVLEVIKNCNTNLVWVPGASKKGALPRPKDLDPPKRVKPWEEMDDDERKLWKRQNVEVQKTNRGLVAQRVLMIEDLATAEYLGDRTFYCGCNMDWRGRVYALPHFNFQREDRVRALFLFSEGVPMDEKGLYWLKVHLASVGDFDKISKASYDERVAWVDHNIHDIEYCADNPYLNKMWHHADKPWQFLAACFELVEALRNPDHVTHLPIAFDGSCSGLQHLSAMTRAAEGSLVNLTPTDRPQDIYSIVAERVETNLKAIKEDETASITNSNLATMCLDYGITRGLVKRNVMTYGYSSQKFGMGSQLIEDLMRPLETKVLAGELEFHPFGPDNGFAASRFLASHIFQAIEEVIQKPAEAMGFLRSLAKALAHENKPVTWVTPVGVPWSNRYHKSTVDRITLWLHDKGVALTHTVGVATGFAKRIDKTKAANGIAPNFVHALDASHLMMTVNGLVNEGVNDFALVHDSFGVHAPHAETLNRVVRAEFVRLYDEFDPLTDILDTNKLLVDSTARLPKPVTKGPLDINEVNDALYAFS